jgi:hypothetical protein
MNKHEQKYCPRCTQLFECKVGNIAQCQCAAIHLTTEQLGHINTKYTDCLCAACMLEERSLYNRTKFFVRLKKLLRLR